MVVRVWDRAIRLFHWSQMALIALALVTGLLIPKSWFQIHVIIGYAIAGLLACRLVWGVFGSEYSRFASFLFHPRQVVRHLRAVMRHESPLYLGHNPAGAVMVTVLLGMVLALVVTGFLVLGGVFKEGPLGPLTSYATGRGLSRLHEYLAYALLPLVAIHILGVRLESRFGGQDLIRAMIDGRKSLPAEVTPPPSRPSRPGPAAATLAALALVVGIGLAWAARQPTLGMPDLPPNPVYKSECGACHWAYHPSLLPAESWRRLMDGLEDHFGEDASMSPEHAALIRGWLTSHAAESWDTLAGNELRVVNPTQPLRVTATPFWTCRHHDIPDAAFKAVKGGRGNCTACHGDTDSGRFSFRKIHLSPETGQ